jgi:hypothetical protein
MTKQEAIKLSGEITYRIMLTKTPALLVNNITPNQLRDIFKLACEAYLEPNAYPTYNNLQWLNHRNRQAQPV